MANECSEWVKYKWSKHWSEAPWLVWQQNSQWGPGWRCTMCETWATEGHLTCKKHLKRISIDDDDDGWLWSYEDQQQGPIVKVWSKAKDKGATSANAKDSDAEPDAAAGKADTACPGDRDDVAAVATLGPISRALENNTRLLCSLAAGIENIILLLADVMQGKRTESLAGVMSQLEEQRSMLSNCRELTEAWTRRPLPTETETTAVTETAAEQQDSKMAAQGSSAAGAGGCVAADCGARTAVECAATASAAAPGSSAATAQAEEPAAPERGRPLSRVAAVERQVPPEPPLEPGENATQAAALTAASQPPESTQDRFDRTELLNSVKDLAELSPQAWTALASQSESELTLAFKNLLAAAKALQSEGNPIQEGAAAGDPGTPEWPPEIQNPVQEGGAAGAAEPRAGGFE